MVKRILQQEQAIRSVLSADRKTTHLIPTWQDIDVLQSIDAALNPLASLTDLLSGETYVTISAVLPLLHLIEHDLLKSSISDSKLTGDIKKKIIDDISNRYTVTKLGEKSSMLLKFASFLDPRFKSKYICSDQIASIESKLEMESVQIQPRVPPPATSSQDCHPPPKKKRNLGSLFKDVEGKNDIEDVRPVISPEQKFKEELERYKSSISLDFEEDPLIWWKQNCLNLPILSQLARKYLCVCATSTSSERLFSAAGNVVTPLRAHLKPDKVEMLTFLSKNL